MRNTTKILDVSTRFIAAGILLFSMAGKFYGSAGSVYIFSQLGLEPFGRYAVGALELATVILLIIPSTSWKGALLGVFMMFGAICMHLTLLEISVAGDGGLMFGMAATVMVCCLANLGLHKQDFVSWA
jgi:uncharacterized membrane protein YphA (DoxX/SURF4 family)